ncbi:MAG TPA: hypothetical protein VGC47_04690 [Acidimicrobiia bacterium]
MTILTSVLADPASERSLLAESTSVSEVARGVLAELSEKLDPEAFSAADQRGTALTIEVMSTEILAGTSGAG